MLDIISIIIPTYKPQDYIYECFDSIRNQSFPHSNIEVIVILNGEKDSYEQEIKDYFQSKLNDFSTKYLYTSTKGVSNARNVGIENATGKYILFLDDDDLISPNYLIELYNNRTENGITVSNVKTFADDLSSLSDDYLSKAYSLTPNTKSIFKLRSFLSSSCCKLIPKELILNTRFNRDIAIGEDSLFMFSLSNRIKEINKCPDSSAIYYRRIRPQSASRKKTSFVRRVNISCKLIKEYTNVYIKSISNYSFSLFLSRIVAGILKIF